MVKTLTKHGNSLALVIDKPVLDLLHIQPETPLQITTDGHSLIVEPLHDAEHKTRVRNVLETTNRKYGRALKKLAE